MYYVYLLRSQNHTNEKYVGFTKDLKRRLKEHNEGKSYHTAKFKSWSLIMYIAFQDKLKACRFEIYLKKHAGRAFAAKRLW